MTAGAPLCVCASPARLTPRPLRGTARAAWQAGMTGFPAQVPKERAIQQEHSSSRLFYFIKFYKSVPMAGLCPGKGVSSADDQGSLPTGRQAKGGAGVDELTHCGETAPPAPPPASCPAALEPGAGDKRSCNARRTFQVPGRLLQGTVPNTGCLDGAGQVARRLHCIGAPDSGATTVPQAGVGLLGTQVRTSSAQGQGAPCPAEPQPHRSQRGGGGRVGPWTTLPQDSSGFQHQTKLVR